MKIQTRIMQSCRNEDGKEGNKSSPVGPRMRMTDSHPVLEELLFLRTYYRQQCGCRVLAHSSALCIGESYLYQKSVLFDTKKQIAS